MHQLKEVLIETTRRCNLQCLHCGSECKNQASPGELTVVEWMDALDQLAEMKVEKIVFSGGEPTLKNGFEKLILHAGERGIKFGFISNGLAPFRKSLREACRQSRPFAIGLSIDGLKETHNKIRRNEKSWLGLTDNISTIQEMGVQICAITTLHKLNFPEMPRLAVLLEHAEVESWQLQLAMPAGRMDQRTDLLITEADFKKICRMILSLRKRHPKLNIQAADCFGLAPENSIRSDGWSGCLAGISSMAIDASGNVMPCLSLQSSPRLENLRNQPIAEIWEKSPGFNFNRRFATKEIKGKCAGCEFLTDCRGGCNSQSFSYYGYFHSSPFCFTRSFYQ